MTKRTVGLDEASKLLGISKDALRKRAARGTIDAEKGAHGRWLIVLDNDLDERPDNGLDTDRTLLNAMEKEIEYLRRENERKDHIIMSLVQRVPQLGGARDDDVQDDDVQEKTVPWWRRLWRR